MNMAQTIRTDLNVLGEKAALIPPAFSDSRYVFLANAHPAQQRAGLAQLKNPRLVVCDTMNCWIDSALDELIKTLGVVYGIVFNDAEVRQLTGRTNLVEAGRKVLDMG